MYETAILGLILFAACRPAHEDWLNERSSTPPVSSTMHALKAVPAALLEPALLGDALLVVGVDLVPHAARAMAATEATATIFIADLKALSLPCNTSVKCTMRRTFCDSTRHPATLPVGSPTSARKVIRHSLATLTSRCQPGRCAIAAPCSSRAPMATARSSTTRSPWCRS